MPLRFLLFLIVLSGLSLPAAAQTQPGDPCATAGLTRTSGGPDQIPALMLVCDGTAWQLVNESAINGRSLFQVGHDPGACDMTKTGRQRYNETDDEWQYCTGSAWRPFEHRTTPGICPVAQKRFAGDGGSTDFAGNVWGNGTNIFALNDNNQVRAYSFNGTSWVARATRSTTNRGTDIWGDGTYLYVTAGNAGVHALTYNNATNTWSAPVTYDTGGSASGVWGDGTYIYVADGAAGVAALSFNGSAWTHHATYNTPGTALSVWGDGTYIYVADGGSGVRALTWNGSAWTSHATRSSADTTRKVWGDGTYIYVADGYGQLRALAFNGSAFTLQATYNSNETAYAYQVWVDANGIIYAVENMAVDALVFNGTTFSVIGYFPSSYGPPRSVWGDGDYLYVLDSYDGLIAYPQCQP